MSSIGSHNARCVLCNLYMSYEDMENSSVVWEEDEWAHWKCWSKASDKLRKQYRPYVINGLKNFWRY